MRFHTPFVVRDGNFCDCHFTPLKLSCVDYRLGACASGEVAGRISCLVGRGVNMLRLVVDDCRLADGDGNIPDSDILREFDEVVEQAFRFGLYLTLVPLTRGKAVAFDGEVFSRQQRYFGNLFSRKSSLSGRRIYEYENIIALEVLVGHEGFSDQEFDLYCGRVMMEVFIDHYFAGRVLKISTLNPAGLSDERREIMKRHQIEFVEAKAFSMRDDSLLRYEASQPGIPESVIRAGIREPGAGRWGPLAVSHAMSVLAHPHANGGAEGWLTFAADVPAELRLDFPAPVHSAKFRPSMLEELDVKVDGCSVELTIPSARYGALEVNYDAGEDAPSYTVYILGDKVDGDPVAEVDASKVKYVLPGTYSIDGLDYGDCELLYFMPGLHDVGGEKIPMKSGCDIYVSRGAVIRGGVIAEEVEGAKIFGQGVLDGSATRRDVGENRGSRMGEKWIDDAGREGFVCFFKGRDIVFDGPVIFNSDYWNMVISGTENATVRNHKAVTWLQNTDGIQPRSCNNLLVENCFLKCADDCIAVKTRRTLNMQSANLVFRDLVLWHDRVGNGLQIGHTSQADVLENVRFENIYAIYCGGSGHCLGMHIIDHSLVRNVVFENIYAEGYAFDRDFGFCIAPSYYTTDDERGRIKGVTVRRYFSEKKLDKASLVRGFDAEHMVENVVFEDIYGCYGDSERVYKVEDLSEFIRENSFSSGIEMK